MMPTMREETVTKKKPKTTTSRPIRSEPGNGPCGKPGRTVMSSASTSDPKTTRPMPRSRSVRTAAVFSPPLPNALDRLAKRRDDRRQRLDERHDARAGHRARADVADVGAVDPLGVGVTRHPGVGEAQVLQVLDDAPFVDEDRDQRNQREPREHAARGELAGDAGPDDVAEAQVLRRDVAGERRVRDLAVLPGAEPGRRLAPEPQDAVEELVEHRDADALEDHAGEVAALLAGDQDVRAGHALGVLEVAVLLDDEGAAQRNHEEDAERAAHGRQHEDRDVLEVVLAVGQEEQRRHREDDAGRDRLARPSRSSGPCCSRGSWSCRSS